MSLDACLIRDYYLLPNEGTNKSPPSKANFSRTMKRMKKAVLNKAEGRTAHKFQFELKLTNVGALDRVLKGLDGSTLFVQERPSA